MIKIHTASEFLGTFYNDVYICYFVQNPDEINISKIEYYLDDTLYQTLTVENSDSIVNNIYLNKKRLTEWYKLSHSTEPTTDDICKNFKLTIKAYTDDTHFVSSDTNFTYAVDDALSDEDNINFVRNFNKHGVIAEKYASYNANQIKFDDVSTVKEQIDAIKSAIESMSGGGSFEDERIDNLISMLDGYKTAVDSLRNKVDTLPGGGTGEKGADGYSPTVEIVDGTGQHTVKITDKNGEKTFVVKDGKDGVGDKGDKGDKGDNGFSPTVTITEGSGQHTITITDKNGSNSFVVKDGANGKDGKDGKDGQNTSSGNGEVASFNGRKGDIVPQKGDYNIDMITVLDDEGNPITNDDGSLASFIDYLSKFVSDTSLRQHFQKQIMTTEGNVTLKPNQFYLWNVDVASLTIGLESPTDANIMAEYHFMFNSGATATTLSLPTSVKLPADFTVEANKVYEISILEGCLTYQSWGK